MTRSSITPSRPVGSTMTARRFVAAAAIALIGSPLATAPAHADPTPQASGAAFTIGEPRVTASTGLALDTDNNVFWTVNERESAGVVYAIGPDGRTRGTIGFGGQILDVQAIAYAGGKLYIADIGDKQKNRQSLRIHVINRPVPNQLPRGELTSYEFSYPDGPHDAATILVDKSGQIRIVTRAAEGAVYRAPRQLRTSGPNELTRVAAAPAYVTDGVVLPTGRFALRTYTSVEVLEPELYAAVAKAALPYQPQGESLAVSMAENTLLVGSTGARSSVLRVPVPTQLAQVPAGAAVPPPSPVPTAAVEENAPGVEPEGTNRTGTLIALGLALAVSVIAGAVVYLRDPGDRAEDADTAFRPPVRPQGPARDVPSSWKPDDAAISRSGVPIVSADAPAPMTPERRRPPAAAADRGRAPGPMSVRRPRPAAPPEPADSGRMPWEEGIPRHQAWSELGPADDPPTQVRPARPRHLDRGD